MTQALARADRSNLVRWEAGLSVSAEFARFSGDLERAIRLKREALKLARELGDTSEVASTLTDMADIERMRGELVEARRLAEDALLLRRVIGKAAGIAHALLALGEVARDDGRLDEACDLLTEALAITRAERMIADRTTDIGVLVRIRLGQINRLLGHPDLAYELIAEGTRASLAFPLVDATREGLEQIAAILALRGDAERAAHLLGAASRSRRETGYVDNSVLDRAATEALVLAVLGPDRYSAALDTGSGMSLEEAAPLALV